MSFDHDDFEGDRIRGLPKELPPGEELLWQGSPDWKALAIRAFHVRKVAAYFLILVLWRVGSGISEGHDAQAILVSCAWLIGLGLSAIGMLAALAYFGARATVCSITTNRILLQHGIAVSVTMNVPFALIESAALKSGRAGIGDIAMRVRKDLRIGYIVTWPYVRPWRFAHPEPSFRALPDAAQAADLLAKAMLAYAGANAIQVEIGGQKAAQRLDAGRRTAAAA